MDSYNVLNNFALTGKTFESGTLARRTQPVKSIVVPISTSFKNNGYSDLINNISKEETENNVNSVIDKETMKFRSAIENTSTLSTPNLKFNFIDNNGIYGDNFINAGFEQSDIDNNTNRLTKSFFRLDFYDSPNEKEQNFLFSEFLDVNLNTTPIFPLNRVFWLKRDPNFIFDNTYRDLFIEALFFNTKDGTVRRFINRDVTTTITLNEYKNNPSWRFARIKVLNPHTTTNTINANDNGLFYIYNGLNGNTDNLINFVEVKIS